MAVDTTTSTSEAGVLAPPPRVDFYAEWQAQEGIPRHGGFYVEDLATLEVGPWARRGVLGAFLNLEGTGGINDTQIVELPPGSSSNPERHLYEEIVHVISGRGSTTVWLSEDTKQTFEWGPGSLFAIPLNTTYQYFNGSGTESARLMSMTSAPTILKLFHNYDFIFRNPFAFTDRFSGKEGYFSGQGTMFGGTGRHVWEANFIPDTRSIHLPERLTRGGGGSILTLELAQNSLGAHISQFQVGTYKKAHKHGPGAHVVVLDGQGYSLLWQEGDKERIKCDWRPNSVVVPPEDWFHQHFNTGAKPARYLALRFSSTKYRQPSQQARGDGSDLSVKEGGWQIEYEDEDQAIHQLFESQVASHGAPCRMKGFIPWCTGEVGPTKQAAAA